MLALVKAMALPSLPITSRRKLLQTRTHVVAIARRREGSSYAALSTYLSGTRIPTTGAPKLSSAATGALLFLWSKTVTFPGSRASNKPSGRWVHWPYLGTSSTAAKHNASGLLGDLRLMSYSCCMSLICVARVASPYSVSVGTAICAPSASSGRMIPAQGRVLSRA